MIGLGARATIVFPVLNSALEDIRVVVPSVQELSGCESAQDVENIPVIDQNGKKKVSKARQFLFQAQS